MQTEANKTHPELLGYEMPTNTAGAALLLGCCDKKVLGYIKEHNDILGAWKAGKNWCLYPSNVLRFCKEVLQKQHHQKPSHRRFQ